MMASRKGITMMELLVSLNIIVFGIFVMAMVMCMLLRTGQSNIDNSSAYIVADSVMKEFLSKNRTYDSLVKGTGESKGTFSYGEKKFSYSITAEPVSGTDDMLYIRATVEEIEASKGKKRMNAAISTLVSPKANI